jgi:hypothetical protein
MAPGQAAQGYGAGGSDHGLRDLTLSQDARGALQEVRPQLPRCNRFFPRMVALWGSEPRDGAAKQSMPRRQRPASVRSRSKPVYPKAGSQYSCLE